MQPKTLSLIHQCVLGVAVALGVVLAIEGLQQLDDGLQVRLVTGGDDRCSLTFREGRDVLEVRSRGHVELFDTWLEAPLEEAGKSPPVSVRPGRRGRFRVEHRVAGVDRRLEVRAGEDGEPIYDYQVDGEDRPFDRADSRWLDEVVLTCFRLGGVDAEKRALRLYRSGGAPAVIDEMKEIDGDEVATRYLLTVIEHAGDDLADPDLAALLAGAGRSLGTDSLQRRVLLAVDPERLGSPEVAAAYFRASDTLGGDSELRTALEHVAGAPLDEAAWETFFRSALTLGNDSEVARLVGTYADLDPPSLPAGIYELLATVGSDEHQSRALRALLTGQNLSQEETDRLLRLAAGGLGNDEEAARVLAAWAESAAGAPAALAPGALELLRSIGEDHVQAQAIRRLLAARDLETEAADRVLGLAADNLGNDEEAARVLAAWAESASARLADLPAGAGALELLRSIGNDELQNRAAQALVAAAGTGTVAQVLAAVDIGNDQEMATLLIVAAQHLAPVDRQAPALRTAVDRALESIGSSEQRQRAEMAWARAGEESQQG